MCASAGLITPATVVDHIREHRGDLVLFWQRSNFQSLCAPHHDSAKQKADGLARLAARDPLYNADGYPTDNKW